MKEKIAYALWGVLFIICAGLGFVTDASGAGKVLLTLSSLICFLPGVALLYWGHRRPVRIISICSLGATLVLLVANFFSVLAPKAVGDVLYVLLVVVSSPMVCSQYWVLSMFIWACLLMATLLKAKR